PTSLLFEKSRNALRSKQSFAWQQAADHVLHPFSPVSRQRPRARLSDHVKIAFELSDSIAGLAVFLAPETQCDLRISNAHIFDRDFRQPLRQRRIKEQNIQRRIGINSDQRLNDREWHRG